MQVDSRPPLDARLRPYVRLLWHYTDAGAAGTEQALPSGTIQLLINLNRDRLHWWSPSGQPESLPGAIIQGLQTRPFGLDRADQQAVIGAVFRPGAARALLGVPADTLTDRHVALADLWDASAAAELADRLRALTTADARLGTLERLLLARLGPSAPPDPLVREALRRMAHADDAVTDLAASLGLDPRRFRRQFRSQVGLNPKTMSRVLRFQRALTALRRGDRLCDIALASGYYDQAHFSHEFHGLSGIAPAAYRRLNPVHRNHLR